MKTLVVAEELDQFRQELLQQRKSLALVPTMGALHSGHLHLIKKALNVADIVLCSIFVNPRQFGPTEDFAKYPRTIDSDLEKLASAGAHAVYLPSVADIYPPGFSTAIHQSRLEQILCGESRPGHFSGVLTIVCKLFLLTGAQYAVFGKKDYQQLIMISQMVQDLHMPIQIIACDTQRESSGLAMSSRNAYLKPEQRSQAACLFAAMTSVKVAFEKGEKDVEVLEKLCRDQLAEQSDVTVEYISIRQQRSLEISAPGSQKLILLLAVKFHGVRLIDNLELN
jgi:pantoate--beta-alanine ligase